VCVCVCLLTCDSIDCFIIITEWYAANTKQSGVYVCASDIRIAIDSDIIIIHIIDCLLPRTLSPLCSSANCEFFATFECMCVNE